MNENVVKVDALTQKPSLIKCPMCGKAEYTRERGGTFGEVFVFTIKCDCTKYATRTGWYFCDKKADFRNRIIRCRARLENEWKNRCESVARCHDIILDLEKFVKNANAMADAIASEPYGYYGWTDAKHGFEWAAKRAQKILEDAKK